MKKSTLLFGLSLAAASLPALANNASGDMAAAFNTIDLNHSNTVDFNELSVSVLAANVQVLFSEFTTADINHDAYISYAESDEFDVSYDEFMAADKDNNSLVDWEEFMSAQLHYLFDETDLNHNGEIDVSEFRAAQ